MKWNILGRRQFLIAPMGACLITKVNEFCLIRYGTNTNRMLFIGGLIGKRSHLMNRKLFALVSHSKLLQ